MKESMSNLGKTTYDDRQVRSAVEYIARLDPQLIADETYFVACEGDEIIGCGGWSRRAKLFTGGVADADPRPLDPATEPARIRAMFVRSDQARRGIGRAILEACEDEARRTGFRTLELMSTLPGLPLYAACGYVTAERVEIELPDGTRLGGARMTKKIADRGPRTAAREELE
jgi:GNAT superfamily N-acetyltransferase